MLQKPLPSFTPCLKLGLPKFALTLALLLPVYGYSEQAPSSPQPPATAADGGSEPQAQEQQEQEQPLVGFFRQLSPDIQRQVSQSLLEYRSADPITKSPQAARLVWGEADNPVHLVEWLDIRCPHCRNLHNALNDIRRIVPQHSWSEELRHFPLDSECNPYLKRSDGTGTRCLAAKVLICLSGTPRLPQILGDFFHNQSNLSPDLIWKITATDQASQQTLRSCVDSPATATKLQQDLDYAMEHKISGTPLVVINGRKGTALPHFIYAMILAQGDLKDPAFRMLPPSRPLGD